MNSGKSRVKKHPSADTLYITVPASVAGDTTCPIAGGDEVYVIIEGKNLVITKEPSLGRSKQR